MTRKSTEEPLTEAVLVRHLTSLARVFAPGDGFLNGQQAALLINRSYEYIRRAKAAGVFLSGDIYLKSDLIAWQKAAQQHKIRWDSRGRIGGNIKKMKSWLSSYEAEQEAS